MTFFYTRLLTGHTAAAARRAAFASCLHSVPQPAAAWASPPAHAARWAELGGHLTGVMTPTVYTVAFLMSGLRTAVCDTFYTRFLTGAPPPTHAHPASRCCFRCTSSCHCAHLTLLPHHRTHPPAQFPTFPPPSFCFLPPPAGWSLRSASSATAPSLMAWKRTLLSSRG